MSSSDPKTPPSAEQPRKGPLSFLSGAVTAALGLAANSADGWWYFAVHPPHYSSPIAQNIAVSLKTLLVAVLSGHLQHGVWRWGSRWCFFAGFTGPRTILPSVESTDLC